MKRGVPGTTESCKVRNLRAEAFVPNSLPPDPPLKFTKELVHQADEAMLALGRLDARSAEVSDLNALNALLVRREALYSLASSGLSLSLTELLLHQAGRSPEAVPARTMAAAQNGVAALVLAMTSGSHHTAYAADMLNQVHTVLAGTGRRKTLSGDRLNDAPGRYRNKLAWPDVLRPKHRPNMFTPPDRVPGCMQVLYTFTRDDETATPGLLKAALAHAQFELIHPYADEVARMSRIASLRQLQDSGLVRGAVPTLSLHFMEQRSRYHQALDAVRYLGDWEVWVSFFVEAVTAGVNGTLAIIDQVQRQSADDGRKVERLGRGADTARAALRVLQSELVTDSGTLVERTGFTAASVNKALRNLARLGITGELTGYKRNRLYVHEALLGAVFNGAERPVSGRERVTNVAPAH